MRTELKTLQNPMNKGLSSVIPSPADSLYNHIVFGNIKIEERGIGAFNPEKNQFIHYRNNLNSALNSLML